MYSQVWLIFVFSAILQNFHIAYSKTYYFNVNKSSNEFLIYNRVNLNKEQPQNNLQSMMMEMRNRTVLYNKEDSEKSSYPLLDLEWDYEVDENATRDNLPHYINRLYDMTAENINSSIINNGAIRILFNKEPNSNVLEFNLEGINLKENISDAELHFYLMLDETTLLKPLVLRLFQVEDKYFNKSILINPDAHKLLNVIYILQAENGWQVFKLKNVFNNLSDDERNLTLLLTVSKPNENQFSFFQDVNNGTLRTFLVVKTTDFEHLGVPRSKEPVFQPASCRKHDLYVDFRSSDWSSFIIAPEGYTAFSCFGRCYKNSNSLPNHSKILIASQKTPSSLCCVPTYYIPLPLMFYDKYGNVVIKTYKDMIVGQCGCR